MADAESYIGYIFTNDRQAGYQVSERINQIEKNKSIRDRSSINEIINHFNNYEPTKQYPYLELDHGLSMTIQNVDREKGAGLIHGGSRQIRMEFYGTDGYPALSSRLRNEKVVNDYFGTIVEELVWLFDGWLGLFGDPTLFVLNPKYLMRLPTSHEQFCNGGPLGEHILHILNSNGLNVSEDSIITESTGQYPDYRKLIDGDNIYQLEFTDNYISISDISDVEYYRDMDRRNSEYLRRILGNEYHCQFFIDSDLANNVGMDVLESLSLKRIELVGDGYFIDWKELNNPEGYRERNDILQEMVIPHIIDRIEVEYMESQ